jgi:hypothetical protein
MFVSVSLEASECHRQPENCADLAQIQCYPKRRQEYLEMQRRWLGLARSYESASELLYQRKKRRSAPQRVQHAVHSKKPDCR